MKRLYRDSKNKMICGVCQGIADYLNVDVTIIRLIWAILGLSGGIGLIAYIAAVFIIPDKYEM